MATTAGTPALYSPIPLLLQRYSIICNSLPKTRPPRTWIILGRRRKQRSLTICTFVNTLSFLVIQRWSPSWLCEPQLENQERKRIPCTHVGFAVFASYYAIFAIVAFTKRLMPHPIKMRWRHKWVHCAYNSNGKEQGQEIGIPLHREEFWRPA